MSVCRRTTKHIGTFRKGKSYSINIQKARNMRSCLDNSKAKKPRQVFITLTNKAQLKRFKFSYLKGVLRQMEKDNDEQTSYNMVATDMQSYQK